MDWRTLQDPDVLARFIAVELRRGHLPGRLRIRLIEMGVAEDTARDAIRAIQDEGAEHWLAAHAAPRRQRVLTSLVLIALGIGAVLFAATYVAESYVRWPVFLCTGLGLLAIFAGLSRIGR